MRFVTSDTGIGIPKSQLDNIFDSFTQVDGSYTRKQGGTGLGLAISKEIVEMMGGRVGVESEPGKGSVFWFAVHLIKQAGCKDIPVDITPVYPSTPPMDPAVQPSVVPNARARVLVVEDDSYSQQVMVGLLENLGYQAEAVGNGKEALEALETTPYDLVLMDIQMPVMDGFEATRAIRDSGSRVLDPEIPIVAITAHAFNKDREKCIDAGMNDYLTKPINTAEFQRALEQYLPGR
jgi:CheY-like chemotaxis protein